MTEKIYLDIYGIISLSVNLLDGFSVYMNGSISEFVGIINFNFAEKEYA